MKTTENSLSDIWRDELIILTCWRDELIDFEDLRESILQGSLLIRAQSCGLESFKTYIYIFTVILIITVVNLIIIIIWERYRILCSVIKDIIIDITMNIILIRYFHHWYQYGWYQALIIDIIGRFKICWIPTFLFSCQGSWRGNI